MLPKSLFRKGVFLAPMAVYSDIGLRRICFDYGADYTFTEMMSAHSVVRNGVSGVREIDLLDPAVPTSVQIITPSPEMLGKAISLIQEQEKNFSSFCLNLGCPHLNKAGAFLLDRTDIIEELFKTMRDFSKVPISAKIRLASDEKHLKDKPYLKIAGLAEKYLDFIVVHARTREQMYSGPVNLSAIKEIKSSVSIPVVGNGDIKCALDAGRMFDETGCDAVMIGRAALKKPFLFKEIKHYLKTGEEMKIDEKAEKLLSGRKYLELQEKYRFSMIETKVHLQSFFKGSFKKLNLGISKEKTVEGMKELVMAEYDSYF
jgi:tRNA-dihydrouridine synthase B